jgi:hypothetical protein
VQRFQKQELVPARHEIRIVIVIEDELHRVVHAAHDVVDGLLRFFRRLHSHPRSRMATSDSAGDRGVRNRQKTAALPFRLSPWTCDSASPAKARVAICRLLLAALGGAVKPRADQLRLQLIRVFGEGATFWFRRLDFSVIFLQLQPQTRL